MIVLIAGAAVGVSVDIARKFAENGHQVIAIGPGCDGLDTLAAEHRATLIPIALKDATSRDAIRRALTALPDDWQDVDILVNNATLSLGKRRAQHALLEDWEAMIDANCKALVAMTRVVLPGMIARGSGTIVNLSSAREQQPSPGSNVYGATAAFVHQYTLSLKETLQNTGVRATCIAAAPEHGTTAPKPAQTAPDIAETIYSLATLPVHLDINHLQPVQTGNLFSPLTLKPS